MPKKKNPWEVKEARKKAKRLEYDRALKQIEDFVRVIADKTLPGGKFEDVARTRDAEFLSNAAHLVRRIRNGEGRTRR